MKNILLYVVTTTCFVNVSNAQGGLEKLDRYTRSVIDSIMNIRYYPNRNYQFKAIDSAFYLDFGMSPQHCLVSNDAHFATFIDVCPPDMVRYSKEDSINLVKEGAIAEYINPIDKEHVFIVIGIVSRFYGKEERDHWKKYAEYVPAAETKAKFNADTAIYVTLPVKEPGYINNYNHCTVLIIQKKGRGSMMRYFLYDDKAKENLKDYIAAMEASFKYGDELPVKKVLEDRTIVTIRRSLFKIR